MIHPYGMKPSDPEIVEAIRKVINVHNQIKDPETETRDLGVAGPEMYYGEFLSVRVNYVDKLSKEERLDLTINCIKRYLECGSATRLDMFDKDKPAFEWRPIESRVKVSSEFKNLIALTAKLRLVDRDLGMPRDFQDGVIRKGQKVKATRSIGVLVYHDWHIMAEMGLPWLRNLATLKNKLKDSEKEQFVSALKDALKASLEANESGHDEYE
jgi:hypothetical protein